MERSELAKSRFIIVKIGTASLSDAAGHFDQENCARLAEELVGVSQQRKLVVVTSGAVALGGERLGIVRDPLHPWDIATKQACAAVGQPHLMTAWSNAFARFGRLCAQVLLTAQDLDTRKSFLAARRTFEKLLEAGVVPLVNENDTVAVEEIKLSDNDALTALVAACVQPDLVVFMSDVEGLFDRDPRKPGATLIRWVDKWTPELARVAGGAGTIGASGGMATKLAAAKRLSSFGIPTALIPSRRPGALAALFAGEEMGTVFAPAQKGTHGRDRWLSSAARARGTLVVDAGAVAAIRSHGKSLLPRGIVRVEGSFGVADPVNIAGEDGTVFARGLTAYEAAHVQRITGVRSDEIQARLGFKYSDEVVHRSDMVLLERDDQ